LSQVFWCWWWEGSLRWGKSIRAERGRALCCDL